MDEIMLDANINVSNAVIPCISNGVVPFTPVGLVTKQHLDMHHEHVMDASMMMGFVAILILKESAMETSWENVEKHVTGSCFLFKKFFMPHFSFTYCGLLPSCPLLPSQKCLNFYPNILLSNPLSPLPLIISILHLYSRNITNSTSTMPTSSSASAIPYMAFINNN
jgi:hypothetical protein